MVPLLWKEDFKKFKWFSLCYIFNFLSFFIFMLWVSLILQVDLSISLSRFCLFCLSGLVWGVARHSLCVIISLQLVYMKSERPGSHQSISQTELKRSYSFTRLTQSAQPAGTWGKVLEGSGNKDGARMTMRIVHYVLSAVWRVSYSELVSPYFVLSYSCFHSFILSVGLSISS